MPGGALVRDSARQVPGYSGPPSGECGAAADCCDLAEDVGAGAEAGIQQASRGPAFPGQRVPGRCSDCTRTSPSQSRPSHARSSRIAAANSGRQRAGIDILQAQQKPPAVASVRAPRDQRAEPMTEMQVPGRAWGEARDDRFAHRCWLGSLRASVVKPSVGRRTITRVASGTRARNQAATSSIREPTLSSSIV